LDAEKRTGFKLERHKTREGHQGARSDQSPAGRIPARDSAAVCNRPHPSQPATGAPYTNIRKQWDRLIAIAARRLGYPLQGRKGDFTFRHTGAPLTSRITIQHRAE
jgi:hypothetical protein